MTIVDEELHHNLLSIMWDHNQSIIDNCPENSFAKIFWNNQYKAASQKSCKQFRWHPAVIRWCIFLHHKSSKAYELLRKTGLYLPTQRTLRDYTHALSWIIDGCGVMWLLLLLLDWVTCMNLKIKRWNCPIHKRNCHRARTSREEAINLSHGPPSRILLGTVL